MEFIDADLETALQLLNKLDKDDKPLWGTMSAQRMVEHLTDTIRLACGEGNFQLEIPEEKVERAQSFLASEHPMPKNFVATFAPEDAQLRNEDFDLAIDEFSQAWIAFEEYYEEHPDAVNIHPNFGKLSYKQWIRIHSKHLTHHLQQFGILK